MLHLIGQP
jgi:hypothetical protein